MSVHEQARAVVEQVKQELPKVWLGGRQRHVLEQAIAQLIRDTEARVWDSIEQKLSNLEIHYQWQCNVSKLDAITSFKDWCRQHAQRVTDEKASEGQSRTRACAEASVSQETEGSRTRL